MTDGIGRREAMAAIGTVGLGSLLAACSGKDGGATTATVPTTTGGSAQVQPQTATGAAIAGLFDKSATCTLTPEQTEGPYYFDVDSIRSDIREDRKGVAFRLGVRVQEATSCKALANAVVDIWHCDAGGVYSGFESASLGAGGQPPGGGGAPPPAGGGGGATRSDPKTYLRGAQVTNADGIVEFRTVYPGWYQGRTVHIHAKVHLDKRTVLTTQLYFDEAVNSAVFARAPYNAKTGRNTFNDGDGIFDRSGLLTLRKDGAGYVGVITLAARTA